MKKCQICGKRANMFLTQIVDGKASELALCEECARTKGLFDPQSLAFAEKFFPEEFRKRVDKLVKELGLAAGDDHAELVAGQDEEAPGRDLLTRCPVCGFTLEDYRRTGRLGCPDCYDVFTKELHGTQAGETGQDDDEVEVASPAVLRGRLEEQLRQAIEDEDYEEAARLRDRIRKMAEEENL